MVIVDYGASCELPFPTTWFKHQVMLLVPRRKNEKAENYSVSDWWKCCLLLDHLGDTIHHKGEDNKRLWGTLDFYYFNLNLKFWVEQGWEVILENYNTHAISFNHSLCIGIVVLSSTYEMLEFDLLWIRLGWSCLNRNVRSSSTLEFYKLSCGRWY